ncbi:fimbrillin family protein [uncultured Bacteroides sp.]|uniref:fimbrillin family protein n=1 Tax=uncultured Bacteroides sp. TaxID=162156 RepID=UPI0034189F29
MYRIRHIAYSLLAASLLAACTQDEQPSLQGEMLTFTASIEGGGLTRATVDNTWSGGETVALQINAGGWLNYTADASGNLTGNDYYWQNTDPVTVQGICPATAAGSTTWSVESDQSSYRNYQSGDLLATGVTTVNYGNAANLTFRHQTAKLVVNIVDGPIVPDDPEVTVGGYKLALTGTFTKPSSGSSFGTWTPGEQNGSITPYRLPYPNTVAGKTIKVNYAALVIPQILDAGTKLISILINGQLYTYKLPLDITWKPGCVYTYTITVRAEGLEVLVDDTIQDWTDGDSENGNATDLGDGYTVSEDGNTYTVYTADGLMAWAEAAQGNLSLNCTLTHDIDLSGTEWEPVGDRKNVYTGTFDGNGHTISNLTITKENLSFGDDCGMFGRVGTNATIKDLTLESVRLNVGADGIPIGALAGSNQGTISNCKVSGNISVTNNEMQYVGGIVGWMESGVIQYCHSSASIQGGNSEYVGGVLGGEYITATVIKGCSFSGSVTGNRFVGGIVGYCRSFDKKTACYSTGSLSSTGGFAGGIVGALQFTSEANACYWSNFDGEGVGYGYNSSEGTGLYKVDGTTHTWQTATEVMNAALGADSEYIWETTDADTPPTLVKNR